MSSALFLSINPFFILAYRQRSPSFDYLINLLPVVNIHCNFTLIPLEFFSLSKGHLFQIALILSQVVCIQNLIRFCSHATINLLLNLSAG